MQASNLARTALGWKKESWHYLPDNSFLVLIVPRLFSCWRSGPGLTSSLARSRRPPRRYACSRRRRRRRRRRRGRRRGRGGAGVTPKRKSLRERRPRSPLGVNTSRADIRTHFPKINSRSAPFNYNYGHATAGAGAGAGANGGTNTRGKSSEGTCSPARATLISS